MVTVKKTTTKKSAAGQGKGKETPYEKLHRKWQEKKKQDELLKQSSSEENELMAKKKK